MFFGIVFLKIQSTLVIIVTCSVDLYFRLEKRWGVSLCDETLKSPKMTFSNV